MLNVGPRNRIGPQGPTGPEGAAGVDGATWHFGSGEPGSGLGKDGDFFLSQNLFDIYRKEGEWVFVGNIKGPKGKKGDQGEKGEQGLPGYNGLPGPAGNGDGMKGRVISTYGEQSVMGGATTQILSYTVPANKAFELLEVLLSGPNIADYFIKKNGTKFHTARTDFEEYDEQIPFERLRFDAGDIITIEVKNLGPSIVTFNGTLLGDLFAVA